MTDEQIQSFFAEQDEREAAEKNKTDELTFDNLPDFDPTTPLGTIS